MNELAQALSGVVAENAWLIKVAAIGIGIWYTLIGVTFVAIMVTVLRGFWREKP